MLRKTQYINETEAEAADVQIISQFDVFHIHMLVMTTNIMVSK